MSPVVKCVVWDLDDTVWDGVLLEGDRPDPRPEVADTIRTLDQRGILAAVASRGEYEVAVEHLRAVGLDDYFVHLEVGWDAKSVSVARVAEALGFGLDTFAFVDNDPSERDEVARAHPEVRCYAQDEVAALPGRAEFRPEFVTDESARRRAMYLAERRRSDAEESSGQHGTDFLRELDLVMTVSPAGERDLARAHELVERTNQLNTTGRTYGVDEIRAMCDSPDFEVLVARLSDRYGDYGTIGLSITERVDGSAVLRLLLMSCRVISRGVGAVLLGHLVDRAIRAGASPCAEFVPSPVNRIMLVTLRFAGFEVSEHLPDGALLLRHGGEAGSGAAADHVRLVEGSEASVGATVSAGGTTTGEEGLHAGGGHGP